MNTITTRGGFAGIESIAMTKQKAIEEVPHQGEKPNT
jgi:hypothetical protein